jgi:hypothetical protein
MKIKVPTGARYCDQNPRSGIMRGIGGKVSGTRLFEGCAVVHRLYACLCLLSPNEIEEQIAAVKGAHVSSNCC